MEKCQSLNKIKQASSYAFEVRDRKDFYQLVSLLDRTAGKGNWTMRGRPLRRIPVQDGIIFPTRRHRIVIVHFKNKQDSTLVLLQRCGKKID